MGFMDKFADIFKERPEDDFDDFYDDTSSDSIMICWFIIFTLLCV